MEFCEWCDQEYDVDDYIEADYEEPLCEPCDTVFCSPRCLKAHQEGCEA